MKTTKCGLALILALLLALSAIGAMAASGIVAINSRNFPDPAFRKYVKQQFDANKDNKLSANEVKSAKKINLNNRGDIKSLKGIEFLTSLTHLQCFSVPIKELDLRKNTKLKVVDVSETKLTALKLGKHKSLRRLDASFTKVASFDIGGCPLLLKALDSPYYFEESNVAWAVNKDGDGLFVNYKAKIMNGKKLLRKYAKPTSMAFTKSSITMKVDSTYDLHKIMKLTPATAIYPINFTTSNDEIADVYDGDVQALKKGTATIKAKVKGLNTISITVRVQ